MLSLLDKYLYDHPKQHTHCMSSDNEYVTLIQYAICLHIDLTTFPTLWAVLSILLETQDGKCEYVKHLQEEYNNYYKDKSRRYMLNGSHKNKPNTILSRAIHSKSKHKYRNVFGDTNIQYHDFDNGDALTFTDKYTALLQQELQNPYWCLHDPITTKSYQISSKMDIETMPHAMYFSGNKETITKIKQVPYQVIDYDDKGMFQAKLMDNTQVEIFIDNGATPSVLPLNVYNKYPILQKYPKTESHTPIHTGGGMIESHFWIEIPLRLENQIIQIKTLVCDSECP